jgi:hypothetical protein
MRSRFAFGEALSMGTSPTGTDPIITLKDPDMSNG